MSMDKNTTDAAVRAYPGFDGSVLDRAAYSASRAFRSTNSQTGEQRFAMWRGVARAVASEFGVTTEPHCSVEKIGMELDEAKEVLYGVVGMSPDLTVSEACATVLEELISLAGELEMTVRERDTAIYERDHP